MKSRIVIATAVVSMCTAASGAVAAGRSDLQAACFGPQALAAQPSEATPVKLGRAMSMRVPQSSVPEAVPAALPRGAIRRVDLPNGRKLVALTLDLCEQWSEVAGYDGAIVDYLRANKVKATFFAGGKWMATHTDRTQQLLADDLFEIGTHGWAHRNVRGLNGPDLLREITAPSGTYKQLRQTLATNQCAAGQTAAMSTIPDVPTLYRFPYGACNASALDAVHDAGMLAIQWDVSTGDPAPTQSAQAIARTTLANTRPGSIIIAHANGRGFHTAAALPLIIPALRAKGYQFVTVSELLAAGRPVLVDTCYDSRPGDTDRYDAFFQHKPVPPPAQAGATRAPPPVVPR
jgi:peptidoglycan-N-acetylglucosamine deacetylase